VNENQLALDARVDYSSMIFTNKLHNLVSELIQLVDSNHRMNARHSAHEHTFLFIEAFCRLFDKF
jgi:hypothetical protein